MWSSSNRRQRLNSYFSVFARQIFNELVYFVPIADLRRQKPGGLPVTKVNFGAPQRFRAVRRRGDSELVDDAAQVRPLKFAPVIERHAFIGKTFD